MQHPENGMILLVVMVFLAIVSSLVGGLLSAGILENKVNNYFYHKTLAFYAAEQRLQLAEAQVLAGQQLPNAKRIDVDSICGVGFYRVTVSAKNHNAESTLQSTMAKSEDYTQCKNQPTVALGRQAFLVIQ